MAAWLDGLVAYGARGPAELVVLVAASVLVAIAIAGLLGALGRRGSAGRPRSQLPQISVPVPEAAKPGWKGTETTPDGSLQDKSKPGVIQCYDPATGYMLGTVEAMTPERVREVAAAARAAQPAWAQTTFGQRADVLHVLQNYLVRNQDVVARVASRDSGKTMVDAGFGEILVTLEKIRWTVKEGEAVLRPEYRSTSLLTIHKSARVEYVPLGVVASIVSWNYPFHNFIGPVISALYAGNAIVVKVSEYSAWSSKFYVALVQEALASLGHSKDLVQIVTGFADAGDALVRSGVDKITFIGSPGVGKRVMATAAESLTPVLLELGGKDPMILCDDADLNQAFNVAMRGFFQNCGQNCIGLERLIVQDTVYDRTVQELARRVATLRQWVKIEKLIEDAVSKGARLVSGGRHYQHSKWPKGFYMQPTVLADVTPDMLITQEEVFGPVVVLMKFRTDEEALKIANASPYGLGSSVFSSNPARADRLVRGIRSGMCNVNDFAVNYLCQSLPFGGVNISGFDRFAGPEGLRGNCVVRAITTDRFPGVKTDIPRPINYPTSPNGFAFITALCTMAYGQMTESVIALGQMLRLL